MDTNYPNILQLCKDWLAANSIRYSDNNEGNLMFAIQTLGVLGMWSEKDPAYLRFVAPVRYKAQNEEQRLKMLEICDTVTMQRKIAKVFMSDNSAYISVELLVQPEFNARLIMPRVLDITVAAYNMLVREMREQHLITAPAGEEKKD